jgi:EAL domain-containing protein (putative c-di-GMP-specific phosphodiesterase class I)/ActR/RegA family two-component response regulator
MTNKRQYVLLADDEDAITEALSFTLERAGRTVILCSNVDAAEIALAHFPITHLVTDVQFTGDFGFEGLHFLGRVRSLAPECNVVVMTGNASPALRQAAAGHGASVLAKPFEIAALDELLRESASDESLEMSVDESPYEVIRIPSMEEILRGDGLSIAFQPIVRLTPDGTTIFAYEALTRVAGTGIDGPAMLFAYAERRGKLPELNIAMMERAIHDASALSEEAAIFINIDPLTFARPQLAPALYAAAIEANVALSRIVLEVTERSGFANDAAGPVFDELRSVGIRFALDDHGSAYSHLGQINRIRPSFIKISNSFGTAFEEDETKERIVRHTVALARDFGCETILEGIESGATVRAAVDAGVCFLQGFHFSRARAASYWTPMKSDRQAA